MARRLRTAPRKTPRQARSEATVEAILAATARILEKVGFERASTNAIARAAGVSIGSLYQYFPSKDALVAALLERHVSLLIALARSAFDQLVEEPVPAAVRRIVELLFELYANEPRLYAVFVAELPRVGRLKRIADLEREQTELVRAYLEAHRDEVVPKDLELAAFLVVQTLMALTHGIIAQHPERLRDPELAREVSAVVTCYLTQRA
jgi:AcrR family transcriptional regulator